MLLLASRVAARSAPGSGLASPMTVGPLVMAVRRRLGLSFVDDGTSVLAGGAPATGGVRTRARADGRPADRDRAGGGTRRPGQPGERVNNAVARAGSLFAVAALPVVVGLSGAEYDDPAVFDAGYRKAMVVVRGLLVSRRCGCDPRLARDA